MLNSVMQTFLPTNQNDMPYETGITTGHLKYQENKYDEMNKGKESSSANTL